MRTASLFNRKLHAGMSPMAVMDEVGSIAFNVSQRIVSPEIVEQCHSLGRPVAVYTVDREKRMSELIAMGVDALFTDYPDRLGALVSASSLC